jgi:hypothetical protein
MPGTSVSRQIIPARNTRATVQRYCIKESDASPKNEPRLSDIAHSIILVCGSEEINLGIRDNYSPGILVKGQAIFVFEHVCKSCKQRPNVGLFWVSWAKHGVKMVSYTRCGHLPGRQGTATTALGFWSLGDETLLMRVRVY